MITFFLILFLINLNQGQITDLTKQADELFTKLNSNGTERVVTHISNDIEHLLGHLSSHESIHLTSNIFNNMNEFFETINGNETKEILHNLRDLTKNSKVYINVSDENWQMNKLLIYLEILLVLLILIFSFLFGLCVYKTFRRKKTNNDLEIGDMYHPLSENKN